MKYTIELSSEQMSLIAQCLEDVSRFASGQWEMQNTLEYMVKGLPIDEQLKRRDDAEVILKQVKNVLYPEMSDNASKNYNGTEFIGNTYQIYRTILYQLAIDSEWNNVYSYPALPSGNLGTIKITKEPSREKLIDLLSKAYEQGYKAHDAIESGLEPFDPKTYALWLLKTELKESE